MWAMCNNCSKVDGCPNKVCVIWIPKDCITGRTGCPYHNMDGDNGDMAPALWVAVKKKDIQEYLDKVCEDDVNDSTVEYTDIDDERDYPELRRELLKEVRRDVE